MRQCLETLLKFHASARQTREFALARPFHAPVEALVHSRWLPSPWGYQDSLKPRFQAFVEAPPGSLTLLSPRVPSMAKQCAHVVFHEQLITDGALPRDFGEFAALFGAQLLEMDEAFHALKRPRNVPATTIQCEGCCSTEDLG
jgi:hypothetical protein